MTIEELEIIVEAKIEPAIKEIKKLMPQIKSSVENAVSTAEKAMEQVDIKKVTTKVQKAIQEVKNKLKSLKNSNSNNEIEVKINTEKSKKQLTQLEKEIETLQKKITSREMQLEITNNSLDKMRNETRQNVISENPGLIGKQLENRVDLKLYSDSIYSGLENQSNKLNNEILKYQALLDSAKQKQEEITKEIGNSETNQEKLNQKIQQSNSSQSKLTSFFSGFKNQIGQAVNTVNSLKNNFAKIPNFTQKVTNNIKNMGTGVKNSLGHVLKYAGALLSIRGIYSILSNSARSWLSSQNEGAQQLSANIEYMKYAMGSVFAPIIEYVINLVYQLMKAIQSLAYAFSGVNIFAKATANSMKNASGSAKQASKSLAGVHNEINNISDKDSSGSSGGISPSIDLSKMDNTPNSIIEAIKNGNWYEVGATIANKLNEAMDNIPWDKIQNKARKLGKGIAEFVNGGVENTEWDKVGNTIAQGINTAIYFSKEFVNNLKWNGLGKSIGSTISSTIKNINWKDFFQTLTDGIAGLIEVLNGILIDTDYTEAKDKFINGLFSVDTSKLFKALSKLVGWAIAELVKVLSGYSLYKFLWEHFIKPAIDDIKQGGKDTAQGFFDGIKEKFKQIKNWVKENIFDPFVNGFKSAFGIHSPSTVMREQGVFVVEGLLNGISSLVGKVTDIWNKMKSTAIEKFTNIKTSITSKVEEIKTGITSKFKEAYNNITSTFNNIGTFFSNIWGKIKNTFSNLGTNIANAISGAVKSGINGVISMIENTINRAISLINGAINLINKLPGVSVNWVPNLYLPRLAKGNVAYSETMAVFGEYSGASHNPEITTPQNIMRDTFEDVLSDYSFNNQQSSNVGFEKLVIQFGSSQVAVEIEKLLQQARRQNGTAYMTI